jgi:hypothetical protein
MNVYFLVESINPVTENYIISICNFEEIFTKRIIFYDDSIFFCNKFDESNDFLYYRIINSLKVLLSVFCLSVCPSVYYF